MPSNSITVLPSTQAGATRAINLDWMAGGPTTVRLTALTSQAVASGHFEWTLNDILLTPSTAVIWSWLSTTGVLNSTTQTVLSATSVIDGAALGLQIQSPVAALRFNCTGFTTIGFVTEVMQARGWEARNLTTEGEKAMEPGNRKHRYTYSNGVKALEESKHGRATAFERYGKPEHFSGAPRPKNESGPQAPENKHGAGYSNDVANDWRRGNGMKPNFDRGKR
jgi:hypothetical protein